MKSWVQKLKPVLGFWQEITILFVVLAVFIPSTINNQFVWDDPRFLFEWPTIQELSRENLTAFVKGDVAPGQKGVYRPLRSVYYALSVQAFGTNQAGYHVQAVLVHALVSLVVYWLSRDLLGSKAQAMAAGLLFGLHPVHVEAVSWITASFDSIGFGLAIGSAWAYATSDLGRAKRWYAAAIILGSMAVFSNEMALVTPGLWLSVFGFRWLSGTRNKRDLKRWGVAVLPLLLVIGIYVYMRFVWLAIGSREDEYILGSFWTTMLIMGVGIVRYLQLLVLPLNLTVNHEILPGINGLFYHDFYLPNLPASPRITDLYVLVNLGLLGLVGGMAWKWRNRWPVLAWSWSWLLISLAPVMQIFPQSIVFAERFLYIGSVGFVIFLANAMWLVAKKLFPKRNLLVYMVLVIIVAAGYGWKTERYNRVWANSMSLWTYAEQHSPPSALIYSDLARELALAGDLEGAIEKLEAAFQVNPENVLIVSNLGATYALSGELEKALPYQELALKLEPNYVGAILNRAATYYDLRDYQKAAAGYEEYLVYKPEDVEAMTRLAMSYHLQFIYDRAEQAYLRALEIDAEYIEARIGLADLYLEWGRLTRAKQHYEKVLESRPGEERAEAGLEDLEEIIETQGDSLQNVDF